MLKSVQVMQFCNKKKSLSPGHTETNDVNILQLRFSNLCFSYGNFSEVRGLFSVGLKPRGMDKDVVKSSKSTNGLCDILTKGINVLNKNY